MSSLLATTRSATPSAITGFGPYRVYFWAQLAAGALACTGLALALAELHPFVPTFAVAALLVNAVARFLMPAFPTDQSGGRFKTFRGTVHMVLAFVAFEGGSLLPPRAWAGSLATTRSGTGVKGFVVTLGWIVLAGAVATALGLIGPRLRQVFGLIERLFALSVVVWLYVISIELIRFAK
jgi:hypothetical protein